MLSALIAVAGYQALLIPLPDPVSKEIESGRARIVRSTDHDLGNPKDAFDGNPESLMRTPSINPAEIVIEFDQPKRAENFRLLLLALSVYRIDAADTLVDLDAKTGTYVDLTGERRTDSEGHAIVSLPKPHSAKLYRLWTRRIEGDDYVHVYEWQFARMAPATSIRVEMVPGRPEWKPFQTIASGGVVRMKAWASNGHGEIDVTDRAKWSGTGFRRWRPGVGNAWQAKRVDSGTQEGSISASVGGLSGKRTFSIEGYPKTNKRTDVDVLFVEKTPRRDYDAKDLGNGPGWPAEGSPVTWVAHIQSHNREVRGLKYRWVVDGAKSSEGVIDRVGANGRATAKFRLPWKQAGQNVVFAIDAPAWDANGGNNSRAFRTNALSLGMWVDQKLWDHWHDHQHLQNPANETFGDWGNFMVDVWNGLFSEAKHPGITPNGISDRIRLDRVIVVPTHALPLNGGLTSNNPDTRDKTVDLAWGFTTDPDAKISDYWKLTKHEGPVTKNPPAFLADLALIHELHHARYIIDSYGFDVHAPSIQVVVDGKPVVGSLLPERFVRYEKYPGIMGGDYSKIDPYVAGAWERVRGRRARGGNMNSPAVIGEYIGDLPKVSEFRFLLPDGRPAAGAVLSIWHAQGDGKSWYAKRYEGPPDITRTLDADGSTVFEGSPFPARLQHDFGIANTVLFCTVRAADKTYVHFVEVSDLNMAVWRGDVERALFEAKLVDPPGFSQ